MLVRVTFPGRPESDYVVKVRRPLVNRQDVSRKWRDALNYEFENLRLLQDRLPSWIRVPRPLHVDAENLLIAMTVVPGRPFIRRHGLLARAGTWASSAMDAQLHAVGRALRHLHATALERPRTQSTHVVPRFRANIDGPQLHFHEPARRLLHAAADDLERLIDSGHDLVLSHNDFTLDNILVASDGAIGIVDLDATSLNRPEADLASVRLSLVRLLSWIPAGHRREARANVLWAAFAGGYGTVPPDDTLWPFLAWRAVNSMEDALRRASHAGLVTRIRLRRAASAIGSWLRAEVQRR